MLAPRYLKPTQGIVAYDLDKGFKPEDSRSRLIQGRLQHRGSHQATLIAQFATKDIGIAALAFGRTSEQDRRLESAWFGHNEL